MSIAVNRLDVWQNQFAGTVWELQSSDVKQGSVARTSEYVWLFSFLGPNIQVHKDRMKSTWFYYAEKVFFEV